MRVLIVNSLYPPLTVGGAELSVRDLATALGGQGEDVRVVTLTPSGVRSLRVEDGVSVRRVPTEGVWPFGEDWQTASQISRLRWHVREARTSFGKRVVEREIVEWQPDVVHFNNFAGFGRRTWDGVPASIPLVHTLRDYYLICVRTTRYRRDHRCESQCLDCSVITHMALTRDGRRIPNALVGVSRFILDAHSAFHAPGGQLRRVIANRPETAALSHRTIPSLQSIGYIGRIEEAKGVLTLIRAMGLVSDANLRLVIAGTGRSDQVQKAKDAAKADSRVSFVGRMTPSSFFDSVDLVAVPTQWDEPYGRVAAEAAGAGLPVVVSRAGGLPESTAGSPRVSYVDDYQSAHAWATELTRCRDQWEPIAVPLATPEKAGEGTAAAYARLYSELLLESR